jgi:hypothetical protein
MAGIMDNYAQGSVTWRALTGQDKFAQNLFAQASPLQCRYEPGQSYFRDPKGDLVMSDGVLYVSADSPAGVGDQIEVDGQLFEIAGKRTGQGLKNSVYQKLFIAVGKNKV